MNEVSVFGLEMPNYSAQHKGLFFIWIYFMPVDV